MGEARSADALRARRAGPVAREGHVPAGGTLPLIGSLAVTMALPARVPLGWHNAVVQLIFEFAGGSDEQVTAIVGLVESAYRGDASRVGWTTEADLLDGQRTDADAVRAIIAGPIGGILLAENHRGLLGCCQLNRRAGSETYFGMFAVRPHDQGQGVGRAILTEAERIARHDWGSTHMSMTVIRQRLDLIAWYQRLGYQATGAILPFPYGDERYGIPTRPDLEFVELAKSLV
jgi:GNAT superfamily N-acetyltransferase